MLKLAIVLSVVFLASARNRVSWTKTLENMQKKVHGMTDTMISEIEKKFEATQAHATAAMAKLQNETEEFGKRINDELASISDQLENSLSKLVDKALFKECVEVTKSKEKATDCDKNVEDSKSIPSGRCTSDNSTTSIDEDATAVTNTKELPEAFRLLWEQQQQLIALLKEQNAQLRSNQLLLPQQQQHQQQQQQQQQHQHQHSQRQNQSQQQHQNQQQHQHQVQNQQQQQQQEQQPQGEQQRQQGQQPQEKEQPQQGQQKGLFSGWLHDAMHIKFGW